MFGSDVSGSSALEFAIVGPAFLLLLLGTVALGWTIFTISSVNFAAERAGRVLLLNQGMSAAEVTEAVRAEVAFVDEDNLEVSFDVNTGAGGYRIGKATATYNTVFEVPLLGQFPITTAAR